MTTRVWPDIDFQPGDTGRRQWTKDQAAVVLATASTVAAAETPAFVALAGVDLTEPPPSGRILLVWDPATQTVRLGTDADPAALLCE